MRRWVPVAVTFAVLAGGTFTAAASSAAGAPSPAKAPAAKATITSVLFTGSVKAPEITIVGTGFGKRPAPNPAYRPAGRKVCTKKVPTSNVSRFGYDYGTSLFVIDTMVKPNWSAGLYRPAQGVLDCIGTIVVKYTPTQVVFDLGGAYPSYAGASGRYKLAPGDKFQVGVSTARYSGKVKYLH